MWGSLRLAPINAIVFRIGVKRKKDMQGSGVARILVKGVLSDVIVGST